MESTCFHEVKKKRKMSAANILGELHNALQAKKKKKKEKEKASALSDRSLTAVAMLGT